MSPVSDVPSWHLCLRVSFRILTLFVEENRACKNMYCMFQKMSVLLCFAETKRLNIAFFPPHLISEAMEQRAGKDLMA